MTRNDPLSLPEEVLLLALHDEKGTVAMDSTYQYAIGGAALAELLMRERIRLDTSKKKLVHLVNAKPLGDPLLDECLLKLSNSRKPASAQTWVSRFAGVKNLKHRLAKQLCDRGILKTDRDKVMLLFSRRIYPEIDSRPEQALVGRLRQAIFTESNQLDPRTVVLVALADSASLLKNVFDKKELKTRKDRIARIVEGEAMAEATKEAIEAVQAAVMIASITPIIVSTATH
jgi:Golgi phosphoprotein 3